MYEAQPLPIREKVLTGHQQALQVFLSAGTWFRGRDRLAILKESRQCANCQLCADRKSALSPYRVNGEHDSTEDLPANVVEVIHRIKTDSGRLTKAWFRSVMETGLVAEEYVEIVGLVATAIILDSFAAGLGLAVIDPEGTVSVDDPTREKNQSVVDAGAWVPLLVAIQDESETGLPTVPNIARAMGLVPLAVQQFFGVMRCHYALSNLNFDLHRTQVELIAARVSSCNDCFY
jgi:hypothetical protein